MEDATERALHALLTDIHTTTAFEHQLRGKPVPQSRSKAHTKQESPKPRSILQGLDQSIGACVEARKRKRAIDGEGDALDDASLSQYSRFTKNLALSPFAPFLHYVPRLVNVVTLAEALPVTGSGVSLPLDLRKIASRCTGAFYAPRRFAAVQLAYTGPRCRVLVFHTGRLVGTGTDSAMAARLAISRAQRQLSVEAGVDLKIRSFQVINSVGAMSLRATLNCDGFAAAHSATSHYDRNSFVGLAWRPRGEDICCEVYSTGRGNLPGSVAQRQLFASFSRMLPELLRFSSSSGLLSLISEEQQAHHRVGANGEQQELVPVEAKVKRARKTQSLTKTSTTASGDDVWAGWGDNDDDDDADEEDSGLNLAALGL